MPGYHLPYFTAAARGTYAKHGLEVEIIYPEPGTENVRAVAAGRYDLCLTSVNHFLNAKAEDPGMEARFVFMIARRSHMAVFFLEGRSAAHGNQIATFRDLEGASILGEENSPFTREYMALMARLSITPGPLVELAYEEVMGALALGKGDAAVDHLDLLPAFEEPASPLGVRVRALPFHQAGLDVYGSGLVAGTGFINSRPDAVGRLVAALQETLWETRADPSLGLRPIREMFPEVDPQRALTGWQAGEPLIFDDEEQSDIGAMDAEKWRRTIGFHADAHGTLRLAPEAVFDGSFV